MASNPMQRKARNSFLLGMFITMLIAGVIIAFLFIQLKNKIDKEKAELQASVQVYVLNQDVSSGQVITTDMLTKQTVNRNFVPSNATGDITVIQNYALQDKEGNNIYTKVDNNQPKLCINKNNKEYEVKQEEETDNYYILKNNDKEYLELDSVPLVAKVSMKKNSIITTELLSKADNIVQDDVRKQEYNILVLPMDLTTGDYIDVRVMFPNGQDYIVVSKKEVELPDIGGVESTDTIWMNLSEDEILHMSCAIVDSAQVKGTKIYATKYTEAGMQNAAIPTYPINESTSRLLQNDPNVIEKAMNEIRTRYSNGNSAEMRNGYINSAISSQGEQAKSNLETKVEESITNSKNSRKEYLNSLSGKSEQ
ncbi:MAG: SAF domain-containing protein [Clostridia bacterium]|nr:SAF domain-containing protein [Clostridia bacterium]